MLFQDKRFKLSCKNQMPVELAQFQYKPDFTFSPFSFYLFHTVSQHHSFVSGVLFMRMPASLPTRILLEWL